MEESESTLELWCRWTEALMTGLETEIEERTRIRLMENCGRACALHHRDIERAQTAHHGAKGIDELLSRLNQLEDFWCGTWTRDGDIIHSVCETCGCPLVGAGWVELSPAICDCSGGWVKAVFEAALERPVRVELRQAIGRGDPVCEFIVRFDRKPRSRKTRVDTSRGGEAWRNAASSMIPPAETLELPRTRTRGRDAMDYEVRPLQLEDRGEVADLIAARWGSPLVVVHGTIYSPAQLPGFVALHAGEWVGLVTYCIADAACEIVSLDSLRPGIGVGTALLDAVQEAARRVQCRRIWLITTNDNLTALRFYQRRGFSLVAVHRGAVERARRLKPEIPAIGQAGIPIQDEIELELSLDRSE